MIAKMTKVQIGVPRTDQEQFLQWLQEEEALHIAPLTKESEVTAAPSETAYHLAQVQFALEFVTRMRSERAIKIRRSWRNLFSYKPIASLQELEQVLSQIDLIGQLQKIRVLSDALGNITARITKLDKQNELLLPWGQLNVTPRQIDETSAVHLLIYLPMTREKIFLAALDQSIRTAVWHEVGRVIEKKSGIVYLEVSAHKADAESLTQLLIEHRVETAQLPMSEDESPARALKRIQSEVRSANDQYIKLLDSTDPIIAKEDDFKLIYDALLHKQERELLNQATETTKFAFVIAGWLPTKTVPSLTKRLLKSFSDSSIKTVAVLPAEEPPVAFQNRALFRPFEVVTDIFGKPRYTELDPSPLLAVFFLLSFGLALTDAGYGIIMMLLMFTAQRFFRLKRGLRKMVRLLFLAGMSTTLIGALTGGWFGIALEELPESSVRNALLAIKLIDPISQPIKLLIIVFILGIIQLLFAWVVRAVDEWRKGHRVKAVLDSGAWVTIVLLILVWTSIRLGLLTASLNLMVTTLLIVNMFILVMSQGRQYKNIALRLGSGVLSLYRLVNFLSDILSYSRLLALGLATGIIGLVVNLIGGMVMEIVPGVGFILAAVVLFGGHVFNLGINTFGAFIHAGRLQFVEFFPKFIEGGGKAYKPFGRVSKYVDNPQEFT